MLRLSFTVEAAQQGWQLRTVLKNALGFSSGQLSRLKQGGRCLVDGAPRFGTAPVSAGEVIEIFLPRESGEPGAPIERGPLSILYEDEALLAVEKPAGMLTHPSLGVHHGTLLSRALGHLAASGGSACLHPVHRLDRDTSGIVLFAKHGHVHALLMAQMREGLFRKEYAALCVGLPQEAQGDIHLPIGREPGSFLMRKIDPAGDAAHTFYALQASWRVFDMPVGRLRLVPYTGRTHQLRVHCRALGMPLLGDTLYANEESAALSARLGLSGQLLHAADLSFLHPLSRVPVRLHSAPNFPVSEQIK